MANSNFSWEDVLAGRGTFSLSGGTGYSSGVLQLQRYLLQIGYPITPDGQFGVITHNAVIGFQHELGITEDGIVGQATATRLNIVRHSVYYLSYGRRLSETTWGRTAIRNGNFDDIDLLARIIYAEDTIVKEAQKGIAIVIKKRASSTSSEYIDSAALYPNASKWARVVGKDNQYDSALSTCVNAAKPRRGVAGYADTGFVDPMWKNAVDTAAALVNNSSFSATGYKVIGTTISSTQITINSSTSANYYHQSAWSSYLNWYNQGRVASSVTPVAFSHSNPTVIYYVH